MSKLAIVGEAWGEAEEAARLPFIGPSGFLLNQMLEQAGISRTECHVTNVFNLRPKPTNDISNLCGPAAEGIPNLPPLRPGQYVRNEYAPELTRLYAELRGEKPNLIIALGGTATWALLGAGAISKARGTVAWSESGGAKTLPTYHPAAIAREWALRHVTVLDLMKARREAEFPDIRRPHREIWIDPTLEDLETFYETRIRTSPLISFDIETAGGQITCIGFSPSRECAIVIPFVDSRAANRSYWGTAREERIAWEFVRRVLANDTPKLAQNGVYDIHWLWRLQGITVNNFLHDTMLLHHSLQPESQKGLGFLGSVYTNEASWKFMRKKSGTIKKDA